MLSSHLLDEVERTCDAMAIVDRGSVVRQGSIAELLAGTSLVLEIGCSDPDQARALLAATNVGASDGKQITAERSGLRVNLPSGTGSDVVAEINRVLVDGGIWVHRLDAHQPSLESWFLQVTSRLGEQP